MSETVHTVTDLPAKAPRLRRTKIVLGAAIATAAVYGVYKIKSALSSDAEQETVNDATPQA